MSDIHSEFHYSSTAYGTAMPIISKLGSASSGIVKKVRITDIKATCGGTGRTLKIWGQGGHYKPIEYDLPANGLLNLTFNTPYPIDAVSTTGAKYGIVASASGAGIKFTVSGYVERYN